MENIPLSVRMKAYEDATKLQFGNDAIVVARIDGRSFSKFTKGMAKPFDDRFTDQMIETARVLVEETSATVGYTQSDEISLIWHTDNPEGQIFFNGKQQKLSSVCASIATAVFDGGLNFGQRAYFDCRVFSVPTKAEAINYLIHRHRDCVRNAVQMTASSLYSHKELMNKNIGVQQEMIAAKGIDWDNEYRTANKYGTFLMRRSFITTQLNHLGNKEDCMRRKVVKFETSESNIFDMLYTTVFKDGEQNMIDIIDQIQDDMLVARKNNDSVARSVLSVLLGEIQLQQSRRKEDLEDYEITKIISRLKKSCEELGSLGSIVAQTEASILSGYLPDELDASEIECMIISSHFYEDIMASDKPMKYMSDIMSMLKETGKNFDGASVSKVIKGIKEKQND